MVEGRRTFDLRSTACVPWCSSPEWLMPVLLNCVGVKIRPGRLISAALVMVFCAASGCARFSKPGTALKRGGDEIVVAGNLFHTGTRVVTWMDPGGYDAYRVERRFAALEKSSWETTRGSVSALTTPNRYGLRREGLTQEQTERFRGGGWDLASLRETVDQFVLHFDASGTSKQCFNVLHDHRGLSVHFLLDLDGTLYQTLDLKERAWHATTSNTRSIGVEIANIGAFQPGNAGPLDEWYQMDATGWPRIVVPSRIGDSGVRTPNFVARPARREPVTGMVQGQLLSQYDLTPEQYAALGKLVATLCQVFPKIRCDYPRDSHGQLISGKLTDEQLAGYRGLIGHYHIQSNKVDPGPAFQWDKVIGEARRFQRSH